MTFPTIHMNGTSANSLLDDIQSAIEACGAARDALRRMSPNGRDYYIQGPHAIEAAMDEHQNRIAKVIHVIDELGEIAENIWDQKQQRERAK